MEYNKVEEMAKKFADEVMTEEYGERFTSLDKVEKDNELYEKWEYLDVSFRQMILNIQYI